MELNTLAVFGASGRTGRLFIKKALDKGYYVQALLRDLSRAPLRHPHLTWIEGNILIKTAVETSISRSQAVISLIGHRKGSPADLQATAIELIIEVMKAHGISRLLSLTGGGVRNESIDKPGLVNKAIVFILKHLLGPGPRAALLDGIAHAAIIQQSGLDWTIVRGPMLTEDPQKGTNQIGAVGTVKGIKLTREDLATFILDELGKGNYIRDLPFLAN